jgi:hypothetical protein
MELEFRKDFIYILLNNYYVKIKQKGFVFTMDKKIVDFNSYDDFFGERIFPKFLLFSYLGLFLSIAYLPFDYSVYKDTPNLIGALAARGFVIFFALMVVLASKLDYFSKKRVLAIAIFGSLGYAVMTFGLIKKNGS